jgi:endonuclease/exonuclease/phosphatase family metal-dependent hydrolase
VGKSSRSPRLRILSFNIQAATRTRRYRDYLLHSWKQVLPHKSRFAALEQIAEVVKPFDVVALQESDSGSLRSSYLNQTGHLAEIADFPFWTHQANRNVGDIAKPGNGVLLRVKPTQIVDHRLPGRIRGRGALMVDLALEKQASVRLIALHLSLGAAARGLQLDFVRSLIDRDQPTIVLGDFNAGRGASEFDQFLRDTGLHLATANTPTFPSWRPESALDHVLVSPCIEIQDAKALPIPLSDHLPLALDAVLR